MNLMTVSSISFVSEIIYMWDFCLLNTLLSSDVRSSEQSLKEFTLIRDIFILLADLLLIGTIIRLLRLGTLIGHVSSSDWLEHLWGILVGHTSPDWLEHLWGIL